MKRLLPALIAFVAVILFLLIAAPLIQEKLGLYAVAFTELFVMLATVVPLLIVKQQPLQEVFLFEKPKPRYFGGSILVFIGTLTLSLAAGYLQIALFPSAMKVSQDLSAFLTNGNILLSLLFAAALPALCEEALMRGTVLSSLALFKRDWIKVLICAALFGLLHLHIFRFFPTAILGAGLAYIMLKTRNILFPICLHLINNSFSIIIAFLSSGVQAAGMDMSALAGLALIFVGIAIFLIGIAIIFLYFGWKKLDGVSLTLVKRHLIAIVSAVLLVAGLVITVYSAATDIVLPME